MLYCCNNLLQKFFQEYYLIVDQIGSRSGLMFCLSETGSFVDLFCYLCLVFAMLSRLFIAALWSPGGGGWPLGSCL